MMTWTRPASRASKSLPDMKVQTLEVTSLPPSRYYSLASFERVTSLLLLLLLFSFETTILLLLLFFLCFCFLLVPVYDRGRYGIYS